MTVSDSSKARAVVRRRGVALTASLTAALLLPVFGGFPDAAARTTALSASAGVPASPAWGVYVGPGSKNVIGAPAFARSTGLPVTRVIDFLPTNSWVGMTGATWLMAAYADQPITLELSVPMLPDDVRPDGSPWSLEECATGAYDRHWTDLGRNLVANRLPATVVRPGWEFNGSWYRWSAANGKAAAFRGCFQRLVSAMRAVPGGRFTFDWSPNLGPSNMPAELAYPGDAYVDVIGPDVYDLSWTWYPTPVGTSLSQARESAWSWIARGDHGLSFWSAFAAGHQKPLEIPEWGVTARSDGHGGGDNPFFVDKMMTFILDPANNVRASDYFNVDTPVVQHNLTRLDTRFPASAAQLRARSATSTAGGTAAPSATTSTTAGSSTVGATIPAPPLAVPATAPQSPPRAAGARAISPSPVSTPAKAKAKVPAARSKSSTARRHRGARAARRAKLRRAQAARLSSSGSTSPAFPKTQRSQSR